MKESFITKTGIFQVNLHVQYYALQELIVVILQQIYVTINVLPEAQLVYHD